MLLFYLYLLQQSGFYWKPFCHTCSSINISISDHVPRGLGNKGRNSYMHRKYTVFTIISLFILLVEKCCTALHCNVQDKHRVQQCHMRRYLHNTTALLWNKLSIYFCTYTFLPSCNGQRALTIFPVQGIKKCLLYKSYLI